MHLIGSPPAGLAEPAELARLADAVVADCLAIGAGDLLLLDTELAHRELAAAIAEACFARGADVDVAYTDPLMRRARLVDGPADLVGTVQPWETRRLRAAPRDGAASLWIASEELPGLTDDVDGERLALELSRRARATGWFGRAAMRGAFRWSIVDWPTPAWAAMVYPELGAPAGARRLLDDLLWFARLGPDDPDGALRAHFDTLARRAAAFSARGLQALELRGPGTSLDVRVGDGALWAGGWAYTTAGARFAANVPSEEVFTSPVPVATSGTFTCTRPLSYAGRTIEGLAGEFRSGRLVRLDADRDADRDFLAGLFAATPGAERLGEIALVDSSSRIGRTGRTYFSTGLDENVASHIAFGDAVGERRDPAASGAARTVNRSDLHVDVMIGAPELEVMGVAAGGERIPVIRDGVFCI